MKTIDGQTKAEALAATRKAVSAAQRSLERSGCPYPASIADAMEAAAKRKIKELYGEELYGEEVAVQRELDALS